MSAPAEWGEPQTRTLTWDRPEVALAAAAKMTGLAYLEAIRDGKLPPPSIAEVVGLQLRSIGDGEVEVASVPDGSLLNPLGGVHGGVLCTLMDSAMGLATHTTLGVGVGYASIELKVSFLRPLPFDGGAVTVRGQVLKRGRRVSFAEAHAYDSGGRLAGHATSSLAILGG